jgi:tRNA threonylcarbamoyladenosine biosynthesis protein TsaE
MTKGTWRTSSPEQTQQLGQELAHRIGAGTVIALIGPLGSGKTCLAQGICRGLKVEEPVTSPTFILINEYVGRFPVYHFDLYRLSGADELLELGYEEYFYGEGACLVEWAEKAYELLPDDAIEIHLKRLGHSDREILLIDPAGKLDSNYEEGTKREGHRACEGSTPADRPQTIHGSSWSK